MSTLVQNSAQITSAPSFARPLLGFVGSTILMVALMVALSL